MVSIVSNRLNIGGAYRAVQLLLRGDVNIWQGNATNVVNVRKIIDTESPTMVEHAAPIVAIHKYETA